MTSVPALFLPFAMLIVAVGLVGCTRNASEKLVDITSSDNSTSAAGSLRATVANGLMMRLLEATPDLTAMPIARPMEPETTSSRTSSSAIVPKVAAREWEQFIMVNELRREGFVCPGGALYAPNPVPLIFDCSLWKAAKLHSQDMANDNYISHTSKDGQSSSQRASAQGTCVRAENIAAGNGEAVVALNQWKNSNVHCNNIMDSGSAVFAVGWASNSDSEYRHYWTQMLGCAQEVNDTSCYP